MPVDGVLQETAGYKLVRSVVAKFTLAAFMKLAWRSSLVPATSCGEQCSLFPGFHEARELIALHTEAIATKQNCNCHGAVLGPAPGVFMRMTHNRCARSLGRRPGFPCGSHTPNRLVHPSMMRRLPPDVGLRREPLVQTSQNVSRCL